MSVSTDNFLKSIYHISNELEEKVTTTNLSEKLSVSKAAITDMARNLTQKGFVEYQPYREINLTAKGTSAALGIVRKHRLWELFLSKVLKLSHTEIHHEAERLEHQTSDFLLNKIDEYLGYPEFDPHGDPIPRKNGKIPNLKGVTRLSEISETGKYVVVRIQLSDQEVANFLAQQQVEVHKKIAVTQILTDQKYFSVHIGSNAVIIDQNLAKNIYVKPIED
ncbi:MAG: metal-dependent transcriptional regulator [Bacteroidetes bacterium]|jgi:DtxR family Mn-dependent transcriptional regulator|nr:metal-dependent transcriptional regulator [Bacteroidota bacterium]